MANSIRNTGAPASLPLAIRKETWHIGVGDVAKGPTNTSLYYSAIVPPAGGFTIYQFKASGGPSINVATTAADLYRITNTIAGVQSYATVNDCLQYLFVTGTTMAMDREYEAISTDSLFMLLDAGVPISYPRSGTIWTDLSQNRSNCNLLNGPSYNLAAAPAGSSITFDGTNDSASLSLLNLTASTITVSGFMRLGSSASGMLFGFTSYAVRIASNALGFTVNNSGGVPTDVYGISAAQVSTLGLLGNYAHYTFVMTATGNVASSNKIYINGVLQTLSQQIGSSGTAPGFGASPSTMAIASWPNNQNYPVAMSVGTLQIYSKELTQTEITQAFNVQRARYGL